MGLQKYDVIRTMVPFETFDDANTGHKTLSFDALLEAQLSGDFKYNRPCVVLGTDKETGNVILAEMRSNRDKPYRSDVNDFDVAGIDHASAILVAKNQLIYVEPDLIPVIEPDKCGHLSEADIQRFEREFIRVNFRQQLPTKQKDQDVKNATQQPVSDEQLLTKLENVEQETLSGISNAEKETLSGTSKQQFVPEPT